MSSICYFECGCLFGLLGIRISFEFAFLQCIYFHTHISTVHHADTPLW